MYITIINGSPKGQYSVTLQTALYLQKLFPEHTYDIINAGRRIKSLEKDFSQVKESMEKADILLFSYPVYTFLAPAQLHRFIELLKNSGWELSGKIATQITTSKHFYDVTAHTYIKENCLDMGLRFINGLSADMDDLTTEKGQTQAKKFFEHLLFRAENSLFERPAAPMGKPAHLPVTVPLPREKKTGRDIVVVTDCEAENEQLSGMISRFDAVLPYPVRVVNLCDFPFAGGCLGCLNCASTGKCVYKDGFDTYLREKIQTSDAIVYAFTIKDHSMGALFKTYDDRQFCNGHRTVTMGKPVGYIISGDLSEEENLRLVLRGRSQAGGNFLAGPATDEFDTNKEIDDMAAELSWALENNYAPPSDFLGVGGIKIFRDLIYGMRGIMKEDHKFYKEHGLYDFPQKKKGTTALMYLAGAALSNDKIRAKMGNKMNEGMLLPYKSILEKAVPVHKNEKEK